ncbi:MAG: diaminopimelate epimerase [Gemmatimonadota bacterium]|nr:diaminopimelate epimerase [Gemmatimonadota bacterium]
MAPSLVATHGAAMSIPEGHAFYKLTGSGNDFVFFDARSDTGAAHELDNAAAVRQLCAPGTGIGADGVVFLQSDTYQSFRIRYFNRDGSIGELCGNASLCSVRLARELGVIGEGTCHFETDAGVMTGHFRDGQPEIDLQAVHDLSPETEFERDPGEIRIGFANTGVPHLVVLVEDTSSVDVVGRGRPLRLDKRLKAGANVNFVAPLGPDEFVIRTYERGVEAETLACGTGAVASAALLNAWGLAGQVVRLRTKSARTLTVTLRIKDDGHVWPSLCGEARIVFQGRTAEL